MRITLTNLSHRFGKTICFKNLNFSIETGNIVIICGKNGSGKSTLLRIISGFIFPEKGTVDFTPSELNLTNRHEWLGFSAPSINLYNELTGNENLELVFKLKNKLHPKYNEWLASSGLTQFDLNRPYKLYSSGMKQRIKILTSVIHHPEIIIWDEPMSNLDNKGKEWIRQILNDVRLSSIIFFASNDDDDLKLSPNQINIEHYR